MRAVHRAELQLFSVLEAHWRKHRFVEELPVTAGAIEIQLGDVRSDDVAIAALQLFIDDPPLELAPDGGPVREPDDLADTDALVEGEEFQLSAELLVVALLGFLEELEVIVQLPLCLPCGAVDAGQLRLLLIAAPVRSRDTQELERLQVAGRPDVRSSTQVEEFAGSIDAHLVALDLVVDQLELVVLVPLTKLCDRLLTRKRLVHEGPVLLSDPTHPRLDGAQFGLRDGLAEGEVVVEAVLYRRADTVLRVGVQLHDRRREQVCGRVPQQLQWIVACLVIAVLGHWGRPVYGPT